MTKRPLKPEESTFLFDIIEQDHATTPAQRRALKALKHRQYGLHADAIGSGPPGETCGSCKHVAQAGCTSRNYYKCGLCRPHWTRGFGTDIRKRDPACSKWEKAT